MPNVLLLCEYPTISGGERSMLTTLDGIRAAGIETAVIAPPEGSLAEALAAKGVEVLPFVFRDAAGNRFPQDRLRAELAHLLGRRRPDLLHANSLAMGRLSGPVAADFELPSIAHLRDIVRLSARAVADLNRHSRLLAVSAATRAFHVAQGVAAEKTDVLYNGVDLNRFQPRPRCGYLHRELGLAPEADLVGTIGQICLRKGQDVLVHAAAILAEKLPNVHFVIVGERWSDKPESRQFEQALRDAATDKLAGRLHFLGLRNDVDRVLNELSLLVHPARQEPLGRVLLEAAASGVAVVATDVGGTREIFPPDCKAARLVPPDDPDAMAAAVLELMGDEGLRASLAAAARRRAETAFDAERTTAALVEHYGEVLGKK
ncbi:MAG TPA: glycosyltransferase family 4 protein [Thermoguttaceae bacterium]|nr:glycosyltransferase family 4 protein [Thermoguttaceae bacterium]